MRRCISSMRLDQAVDLALELAKLTSDLADLRLNGHCNHVVVSYCAEYTGFWRGIHLPLARPAGLLKIAEGEWGDV